MVQLSFIPWQK